MTTTNNVRTLAANLADGLGMLVWFELRNAYIKPVDLKRNLDAEGLDSDWVPDEPERFAEFKTAMRQTSSITGRFEIIRYDQDEDTVYVGFLQKEEEDEAATGKRKKVEWRHVAQLSYDFDKREWDIPAAISNEANVLSFKRKADMAMSHLSHRFIREKLIQATVERQPVQFRVKRGQYYVGNLANGRENMDRLQRIIRKIGQCDLFIMDIPRTAGSQHALVHSAKSSVLDRVAEQMEKLADWRAKAQDEGKGVRPSSGARMLATFVEIRNQLELYADTLSFEVEDILAELKTAQEEAATFLDEHQTKPANKATKVRATETGAVEITLKEEADEPAADEPDAEKTEAEVEVEEEPEAVEPEPAPEPEPTPEPEPVEESTIEYSPEAVAEMTGDELRKVAATLKIKGRSRLPVESLRTKVMEKLAA